MDRAYFPARVERVPQDVNQLEWTIQGTITSFLFWVMHVAILQQGSGGVGEVRSKAKSKAKARLRLKLRLKAKTNIDSHASPHGVGSADLCIWPCAPLWSICPI